jgi:hypothetical protein
VFSALGVAFLGIVSVVADSKAVSFIVEHGSRLYVYADASGQNHVVTEAPNDPSIRFEPVEADGFLMYVADGIERPETWTIEFHHVPSHHVQIHWDGRPKHPDVERAACMVVGHQWETDPASKEIYPVLLCQRCGKRRDLSARLVTGYRARGPLL